MFERINKRVLLTEAGSDLKNFIETYSDTLDSFIDSVAQKKSEPRGQVRYAMPASCLKTPHFPILLEERLKFPKIDINVTIAANDEIFEKLIKGEIDFGFVTKKSENPVIQHELFAQEQYALVGHDRSLVKSISSQTLSEIPFISYPGMDVLLEFWKHIYFPQKKNFNAHSMVHRGEINHLDGAITMVRHGVGCGVFPRHCVEEFILSKELFAYSHQLKRDPVGEIFIVTRKNFNLPTRVQRVLDTFWKMKSS
ncbi:MAG: hypothetical protein B7Y39_15185 [Bdellovibrio sp. 28-41-41]|nr:MAG: hypothetical protein B7Y39_15185 [Bdellovibrio sp. 28-41-41]